MIATMAETGDGPLTQRPTGRPLSRNRALRRSPTESERPRGRPGDRPPSRLFVFRNTNTEAERREGTAGDVEIARRCG